MSPVWKVFLRIPSGQSANAHSIKSLLAEDCPSPPCSLTWACTVHRGVLCVYACNDMHAQVSRVDSWISAIRLQHSWFQNSVSPGTGQKGIPCVQHFSSLVICLWPLHSPKMTMKDHGSYGNKTLGRTLWSGYRGRSKNLDRTRRRDEDGEGEQMSDISVTRKVRVWAKNVSRYRCCSALSLSRPGDSMLS